MNDQNKKFYQEPLPFKVKRFLSSRGLEMASSKGKKLKTINLGENSFGILKKNPKKWPFPFGLIHLFPRRLFVGKLVFQDNSTLMLCLYGRNQLDEIFIKDVEEEFNIVVEPQLFEEEPKKEVRWLNLTH